MPPSSAKIRPYRNCRSRISRAVGVHIAPAPTFTIALVNEPDRSVPSVTPNEARLLVTSVPPTVNATSCFTFARPAPPSTYGRTAPPVGTVNLTPATPKAAGCLTLKATLACVCERKPAMVCAAALICEVATLLTLPTSTNSWRFGRIVTPPSAPYDWLVTFPNAAWATAST